MKNLFKIGDKVKWGKRKEVFTVERLEEVDVVIVDQNRWEYPVSPSELTKLPKRAVKKEVPMSREFHAYASPKDKAEVARINKELRINRAMQDKILSELEEIDIPTNLRKVGIDYGHEDLVDSVAYLWASARNKKEVNNWPNGYTLAFVLAGILFVIAYCVGMANI